MNRDQNTTFARALLTKVRSAPWLPTFTTATVVEGGTTPTVVVAGDTEQVQANQLGDPAGEGEIVWVVSWLSSLLVLGRAGGSRLLGYATADANDAFTTSEVLDTLTCDVVVSQPNRVVEIRAAGLFSVDTNGASVIVRVYQDGSIVGRVGTHTFPTASVGEWMAGSVFVEGLDPGGYTFDVRGVASGGTGTFAGATSTGFLSVHDAGPVLP